MVAKICVAFVLFSLRDMAVAAMLLPRYIRAHDSG